MKTTRWRSPVHRVAPLAVALAASTFVACGNADESDPDVVGSSQSNGDLAAVETATADSTTPSSTAPASTEPIETQTTSTVARTPPSTQEVPMSTNPPELPAVAPGSDTDFSFALATSAPPDRVWDVWTDVPNWPQWDILTAASIDGPFVVGTPGAVVNPDGSEATFAVTALDDGVRYEITLPLPDAAIVIERSSTTDDDQTTIQHRVQFTGPNAAVFADALAPGFRMALPGVVDAVRRLAEEPA